MDNPEKLSGARRGYVVAPAGHGKTQLIAEAVTSHGGRCELILTHTHAGVAAIKEKLLKLNPSKRNYQVETIDGFILKYVSHYPYISQWSVSTEEIDWLNVRKSGGFLFQTHFVKRVLNATYSGLYVDEYQDCLKEQHAIILEVSKVLPVRVLGDPLQGIFNFKGNRIVDWTVDVGTNYELIAELNQPWRWANVPNADLAQWLAEVRQNLLNEKPISLEKLPECVQWYEKKAGEEVKICYSLLSHKNESVAVIGLPESPHYSHAIASKLRGTYSVVEPIELKTISSYIKKIEQGDIYLRAEEILNFLCDCFTGISKSKLSTEFSALKKKKIPKRKTSIAISDALSAFLRSNSDPAAMLDVVVLAKDIDATFLYRRELYYSMIKTLRESKHAGITLSKAFIRVRENTRRLGRKRTQRIIGSTLLIKGLEFEHSLIMDADALDARNLYVALTRASKTVTIISKSKTLNCFGNSAKVEVTSNEGKN